MYALYLKGFFRRMSRNKGYFFINIIGLTIALSASMLILVWIQYEKSFDRANPDAANIYRVYSHINMNGNNFTSSMAPPPLADVLAKQFPEVIESTRVWSYNNLTVTNDEGNRTDKAFNEKKVYQADSTFFRVFPFKMIKGNPTTALAQPLTVVISKQAAIKYFSEKEYNSNKILGKSLVLGFFGRCKVTGITEDVPPNTHFHYNVILSNASDPWYKSTVWIDNTYYTYILLRKDANPKALEAKFPSVIRTYLDPQLRTNFGTSYDELKSKNSYWEYKLQPLTDIHLHSNFERELEPNGDMSNLYILGAFGCFLIIMACINYANLATAYSMERSKEIGLRKTFGATRFKLAMLMFMESGIITLIASLLSVVVIVVFIHPFGRILGTAFPPGILSNPVTWCSFVGLLLFISMLGSAYPSLHLSSFNVTKAIKGQITEGKNTIGLKRVLVIAQFAISIGLVLSTVLVYKQLNYLREKSPGFDKENILVITDPSMRLGSKANAFIKQLKQNSAIKSASMCSDFPGSGLDNFPVAANNRRENIDHMLTNFSAGYDFLQTFGIKLLQGRDFSESMDKDTVKRVILNETAVRELQLAEPLNSIILTKYLNSLAIEQQRYEVIGVVQDFNFESLHKSIRPVAIFLNGGGSFVCVRIAPGNINKTISAIKETWNSFLPNTPFEYNFLDEKINNLYQTELSLSRLLSILTVLVIFIAGIGLIGITALMVQQRTKEIGVRKVLGAGITDIMYLLNRQYIKGIVISFIIVSPVCFLLMNQWFSQFAYRTPLSIWVYVITGFAALVTTIAITSYQSFKAAVQNPVKSLRSE